MKRILLIIIKFLIINYAYTQDFDYSISELNGNILVTFTPVISGSGLLNPTSEISRNWIFGDGQTETRSDKASFSHTYQGKTSNFKDGYFTVDVSCTATYSNGIKSTQKNSLQYYMSIGIANATYYPIPFYSEYPKGASIPIYAQLLFDGTTNNISYITYIDGISSPLQTVDGIIATKSTFLATTYTPTSASTHKAFIEFYQYGSLLATSPILDIVVTEKGNTTIKPTSGCTCDTSLHPKFIENATQSDPSVFATNGIVCFHFEDISDKTTIQDRYAECASYDTTHAGKAQIIAYKNGKYWKSSIRNFPIIGNVAGGDDIYMDKLTPIDKKTTYCFYYRVFCTDQSGVSNYIRAKEVICRTYDPPTFNPNTNIGIIPAIGDSIKIDTYTDNCGASLWNNPNDPTDGLDWIGGKKIDRYIRGKATPNNTLFERKVQIKLSIVGNYDACLPTVDGVKIPYRTITLTQASMFANIVDPTFSQIPLPAYIATSDVAYYKIGNYYYYHTIPYSYLADATKTQSRQIKIECYDSNNQLVAIRYPSVWATGCTSNAFYAPFMQQGNMYVSRHTGDQIVDNCKVLANRVVIVTSPTCVTITNFSTDDNAIFEAYINDCTNFKDGQETDSSEMYPASAVKAESIQTQVVTPAVKDSVQNDCAMLVYPNPNNGVFSIDFQNCKETILGIEIVDGKGQIINRPSYKNESQLQVNLKGFASGCYTVRVQTTLGYMIRKLTIE